MRCLGERMNGGRTVAAALAAMIPAAPAFAHASDQGLVLLLPTGVYIAGGAGAVALTVLLLAVLPDNAAVRVFRRLDLGRFPRPVLRNATSVLSCLLLAALVWAGLNGPHDPLKNPLPPMFWAVFWVGFVALQGLLGDLWAWANPWTGPVAATRKLTGLRPFLRLPSLLGHSPALATFLGFALFLLADIAPADPDRLATAAGLYWLLTFLAALAFGPRWINRAEGFTMLLRNYALMGLLRRRGGRISIGLSGWRLFSRRVPPPWIAVFMVVMLGTGSFDGLNETFFWLGRIGINPLEFPGRSAVVLPNTVGLFVANAALIVVFALAVRLGLALNRAPLSWGMAFRTFAPTLLPIALGYHIAHYLTSIIVDGQYAVLALNDPMGTGANLLGLAGRQVTTGFFNVPASVKAIWLCQAGAVVVGHVLAVLLAHAVAVRTFGSNRSAALSQAPLAVFMVAYTIFGLWLLASPRGV